MDESDRQSGGPGAKVYQPPSGEGGGGNGRHPSPRESVSRVAKLVAEYKEYLAYFLATKVDGVRLTVRQGIVYAALGVIGFVAASATITMAIVLFLLGAARGLGSAFGSGLQWLGDLIIGLAVLGGIVLGTYIGIRWVNASFRKKTVDKYEQRQNWERRQFGRSAAEQAAANDIQRV
ncbi:MAG: hypothetical protein ACM359_11070 [Bacillota bacterium]